MMSVATLVIGMGLVLTVLGAVISLSKSNKHNVKHVLDVKIKFHQTKKVVHIVDIF